MLSWTIFKVCSLYGSSPLSTEWPPQRSGSGHIDLPLAGFLIQLFLLAVPLDQPLGGAAEFPPHPMVDVVKVPVLQGEDGPQVGILRQKLNIARTHLHDLLPGVPFIGRQELGLPGMPLGVDIVDDGGNELLPVPKCL